MYCAGCGKEMPADARFCPACGRAAAGVHAPYQHAPLMDGLVRPRAGRKIAGVCAAFAARYGWDLTLVRLFTVLIALFTFPLGPVLYVVLWVVLPESPLLLSAPTANPYGGGTAA